MNSLLVAETKGKSHRSQEPSSDFVVSPYSESRELELEIKALRAKILVLEQTLQDTNSGVEHAANVLRMQCTAHIHKSAALHSSLVRAALENREGTEKVVSEVQAREEFLRDQVNKHREEIARLKAELSEKQTELCEARLHAGDNLRQQHEHSGPSMNRRDVATDPISPQALGESAAELAAACSGRLRDAWTQNEKLMEALEAEKRRALMLQLQLDQQAITAPSTWL